MTEDDRVWLLTADLGYKMFDKIAADFPTRFVNVGAAEQLLVGAAVGLALAGKIPICYSITPFLLYRPAEWIRNYLHQEQVPVKLVGSGRDQDYSHDGYTHDATDAGAFLSLFKIKQYVPETMADVETMAAEMLTNGLPSYLNLRRV